MNICFLTNELYPLLPGGIGRLMYNFTVQNKTSAEPDDFHFLLPSSAAETIEQIRSIYDGLATIHLCRPLSEIDDSIASAVAADRAFHSEFATCYKLPLEYYFGLVEAERAIAGQFDVIELPDLGGWGSAIVAAKQAGLAFTQATIACRLHSSLGLITAHEPYAHQPSTWFSAALGLEREVITGSDLVVGHLDCIVEANARHYQVDQAWHSKVRVETPPILLDNVKLNEYSIVPEPDFVFSSRIQHFKRPAVFVRAAICFFERNPAYTGKFRIVSYGWDRDLIEHIEQLPPVNMRDRILFQYDVSKEERNEIIARSIVVVPSVYESLCLFAYESSLMGRPVILAGDCEGFAKAPVWKDGENCLFFDGSFAHLASVMEHAITWMPQSQVENKPDIPYWKNLATAASPAAVATPTDLSAMPVLYYGLQSKEEVNRKLAERQSSCFRDNPAIFYVPRHMLGRIEDQIASSTRFRGYSGQQQSAVELQSEIASLNVPFVLLVAPDVMPTDNFLEIAQRAIARQPDLDLFSGHSENVDPISGKSLGVTLATGQSAGMALLENTVSAGIALVRTSCVASIGLEDEAQRFWFPVFCRKLVLGGGQVLVAPILLATEKAFANERSNTKKLTGSVLDFFGMGISSPVRLLGVDARISNREVDRPTYQIYSDADFITAELAWPRPNPREFPLVAFEPDKGGLLTHPITGDVTIAKLKRMAVPTVQTIKLQLRNASDKNGGLLFRVLFSKHELAASEIQSAINDHPGPFVYTPWIEVQKQGDITIIQPIQVPFNSHIYLMSRLPFGVESEDFAWSVWRQLTLLG